MYWGKDGRSKAPRLKMFLEDAEAIVPRSVWLSSEAGSTQSAMVEQKTLFAAPFSTPKPELLLNRIIHIASVPGDLILDSFAGSGTTGAVAHKMGRRWIMIELGEHCQTHIIPRMEKVLDGADPGGITEAVDWKGGGGFRYFHLAPSLLEKDPWGNWVISKDFNSAMLAEAMCKLHGFTYAPSQDHYWNQGHSNEADFIYVTTQSLTQAQLRAISEEVGEKQTLLVCCGAFRGDAEVYPNLTLKKIPQSVLSKCEWGHDDYSLNIQNLPSAPELGAAPLEPVPTPEPGGVTKRRSRPPKTAKPSEGSQALGLEVEE